MSYLTDQDRFQGACNEARQWRSFARRIDSLAVSLHRAAQLPADMLAIDGAAEVLHGAADKIAASGEAIRDTHTAAGVAAVCRAAVLLTADNGRANGLRESADILRELSRAV